MKFKGFTLAELLIALLILGVIATFTIPKVLVANQTATFKAIGKEAASMVSGAYQAYQVNNPSPPTTMTPFDLAPYMNYVKIDTTTAIDDYQTSGTWNCSNTTPCIKLHNGAILNFEDDSFGGTQNNRALFFYVDPDGKVTDNTTNGPGKSLGFALYYNGGLKTTATLITGTINSGGTYPADPTRDPPWFSWN